MGINSFNNLVLIGFMGSGKTYWGEKWAKDLSVEHFDLDEEISKIERRSIFEIFNLKGEAYFRSKESQFLNNFLLKSRIVLSTGGGTPCYHNNMDLINLKSFSIYLKCPADTLFYRLKNEKNKRPLISHLSDGDLKLFIEKKISEREPYYNKANCIIEDLDLSSISIQDLINV